MAYKVEKISEPLVLGEGPHWDPETEALYFVDSFANFIGRYLPKNGKVTLCKVDEAPSIIIPIKGKPGKYLVTIGAKITELTWDGESATPQNIKVLKVSDEVKENPENRFNDGKVDPTGRLWIGTMGKITDGNPEFEAGSLYSFDENLNPTNRQRGVTITNGMAWSPDNKTMYYIDTPTFQVYAYDYDAASGNIGNRRSVFDLKEYCFSKLCGGDGMTIDADGNLWVAVFGGATVVNIDPRTKKLIRKIDLPSLQITSVAFGGANLDELYVVSANIPQEPENLAKYPQAGCTFRVTGLGVKGLPMLPIVLPSTQA